MGWSYRQDQFPRWCLWSRQKNGGAFVCKYFFKV